ncbi:hypothetical protein [Prosthecobacter vanneervenii]|uniref:Uncharacterized protein n=1 Tax=Prosthecobacter vanneervenii TaxID=48466 RepID=A0A7W7YBJ1_9BACT|nr:hypothetical protein [Prosthecobacter vanneervenii]MBB5032967.1 hypothetical protein [Prosthecobacter vanneervenii]
MISDGPRPFAPLRPLQHVAAFLLAGVLLLFVWLREEPRFWTYAGGYPVWLQQTVLLAFYPLLLAQCALLAFLSWQLISRPSRQARLCCMELLMMVVHWGMLGLVVLMMVANNVANLMDGRPLHDHSAKTSAAPLRRADSPARS